ncbi:hypothetical protein PHMEG_0004394 [Phytophthora megakarya]|uniref:Uncharacterized protein n=1 Tax=Phytophthora megakarya TaxID=4795 RepID=A0A225WU35_9STRA|nr:hypothetical protein PHMEG_0004394 [Phytophthora megakarya]
MAPSDTAESTSPPESVLKLLPSLTRCNPHKAPFESVPTNASAATTRSPPLTPSGQDIRAGRPINYDSGRKGRRGRKSLLTEEFRHDLNHAIEFIPLEDRTDIRT